MARTCQVTGKRRQVGNNVSHSQRKTKRTFEANIHKRTFWSPSQNRNISLKVSKKGLKIIDLYGIDAVLEKLKTQGEGTL